MAISGAPGADDRGDDGRVQAPYRRPGRPRGGVAVADRAQLLAAAERLIRAAGPDVTMEAIAAEAGVTKPVLYRGVGDKDALVGSLAEVLVDRINAAVTAATATLANGDPRAGLRVFIAAYLDVVEADANLYLFVTADGSSNDRVGQALRLADRSARPIAERLAADQVGGSDPTVALTWAYGLVGTLHFVTLWWLRDRALDREALTEHLTSLLWSGLSGPQT